MINIIASSRYQINKKNIKLCVSQYFAVKNIPLQNTVNIVFIGKIKMLKLARTYKKENLALPVLTFAYNDSESDDNLIGEVFICYPQMVLLAAERNKSVDNMTIELIKHGINNLLK